MRVVFILLILLGAALYFPRSRVVVLDTAAPVLDPIFRWSTRGEMRRIARELETVGQTARSFPTDQEAFHTWMGRNFQSEESAVDSWENPYLLRVAYDSFMVISYGPDGAVDTDDDVVVEGALEQDVRRRR